MKVYCVYKFLECEDTHEFIRMYKSLESAKKYAAKIWGSVYEQELNLEDDLILIEADPYSKDEHYIPM